MNNLKHIASYLWLLWSPFLVTITQVRAQLSLASPNRPPQWLVSGLSPPPSPPPPSADWLTDLYRARINNIKQIAIACLGMWVCSASKVIWNVSCGDVVWMNENLQMLVLYLHQALRSWKILNIVYLWTVPWGIPFVIIFVWRGGCNGDLRLDRTGGKRGCHSFAMNSSAWEKKISICQDKRVHSTEYIVHCTYLQEALQLSGWWLWLWLCQAPLYRPYPFPFPFPFPQDFLPSQTWCLPVSANKLSGLLSQTRQWDKKTTRKRKEHKFHHHILFIFGQSSQSRYEQCGNADE